MIREIDDYYLKKDDPNKSCLQALRNIILAQDIHISETMKWGMPCFCYKKKMFCYLWIDKKINEPYILWVEGNHIEHSELERGSRSRMKILRINPNEDLPLPKLEMLLNTALDLYRKGTIKIK